MFSLLSQCAFFLNDHLVLSDHVDTNGIKRYPQSFTIRELKNALHTYIRHASIMSTAIDALIASLEMQFFFYNTTWKSVERATDDDICILLRCDAIEPESPRSKLSSLSAFNLVGAATSLPDSGGVGGISLITSSPVARKSGDTDAACVPTGVISSLSKCYSPTCDESHPCYSFFCPNRNKKKRSTVQCYSNGCLNGYGCYSPTCPCRYEADAEIDDSSTVISVEIRSPSPASDADATFGQSIPKSVYDLPKLSLGAISEAPVSGSPITMPYYSPSISPATAFSTHSCTSSLSPSSSISPASPFSPEAWDLYPPIDIINDVDVDLTNSPVSQTLSRIYTHFPYNSYQPSSPSPSPYSSHYAHSSADLTTPISPNWEPILLISMVGPSVTWVNQERLSMSGVTSAYEHNFLSNDAPGPLHPFSSILKSRLEHNINDNGASQITGADLESPMTPRSIYSL